MSKASLGGTPIPHGLTALSGVSSPPLVTICSYTVLAARQGGHLQISTRAELLIPNLEGELFSN